MVQVPENSRCRRGNQIRDLFICGRWGQVVFGKFVCCPGHWSPVGGHCIHLLEVLQGTSSLSCREYCLHLRILGLLLLDGLPLRPMFFLVCQSWSVAAMCRGAAMCSVFPTWLETLTRCSLGMGHFVHRLKQWASQESFPCSSQVS